MANKSYIKPLLDICWSEIRRNCLRYIHIYLLAYDERCLLGSIITNSNIVSIFAWTRSTLNNVQHSHIIAKRNKLNSLEFEIQHEPPGRNCWIIFNSWKSNWIMATEIELKVHFFPFVLHNTCTLYMNTSAHPPD